MADTQTTVDNTPSADDKKAPIGKVADAFAKNQPSKTRDSIDASRKKDDNKEEAPITSLAQLRDWHIKNGSAPTQKEVDEVRELELKIAEEGAKKERLPSAEQSKSKK